MYKIKFIIAGVFLITLGTIGFLSAFASDDQPIDSSCKKLSCLDTNSSSDVSKGVNLAPNSNITIQAKDVNGAEACRIINAPQNMFVPTATGSEWTSFINWATTHGYASCCAGHSGANCSLTACSGTTPCGTPGSCTAIPSGKCDCSSHSLDACGTCGGAVAVNTCSATAPSCGTTTYGTYACGGQCSRTGSACVCVSDGSCTVTFNTSVDCSVANNGYASGKDNCNTPCFKLNPNCHCSNGTTQNCGAQCPGLFGPYNNQQTCTNGSWGSCVAKPASQQSTCCNPSSSSVTYNGNGRCTVCYWGTGTWYTNWGGVNSGFCPDNWSWNSSACGSGLSCGTMTCGANQRCTTGIEANGNYPNRYSCSGSKASGWCCPGNTESGVGSC